MVICLKSQGANLIVQLKLVLQMWASLEHSCQLIVRDELGLCRMLYLDLYQSSAAGCYLYVPRPRPIGL